MSPPATRQCSDDACPYARQIEQIEASGNEQSKRIDRILQILTDSTLDGGSVVDRVRMHSAMIRELQERKQSLLERTLLASLDHIVRLALSGAAFLLFRGAISEFLTHLPH